jgi:hypothetical protein
MDHSASLSIALVWRESTKGRVFAKVTFSPGSRRAASPILVNIGG